MPFLCDAAEPHVPAKPVIFEIREPRLLRLGNFVSKYPSFHAYHRALSANDEDTALRSHSSASCGLGAGGAGVGETKAACVAASAGGSLRHLQPPGRDSHRLSYRHLGPLSAGGVL